MAIYRGPGGSGDAVNDSSSETRLAVEARDAALAAQAAAEAAQAAAETSETNAQTAETNAETAETNAAASASSASSSASSASTSATNAASSASSASTSATNAASSASSASTSATNAASSASSASSSASSASTSATNAANSATAAQAAQAAAEAAFDAFDDIYLGAKSSDPTVDNDGNALTVGDEYFNTVANEMRVWNGSSWQSPSVIGGSITSLTVTGATALNGGITLGDASGDALTINSSAVSIPNGLTFDGNVLSIDATNNRVGILNTNPSMALDVREGSIVAGTSGMVLYGRQSASVPSAAFGTGFFALGVNYTDNATGGLTIYTRASDTLTECMRITSAGNVGIGTSGPSQKLEIAGTGSTTLSKITTTTGANAVWSSSTGGNFYFGIDNSAGTFFGTAYGRALYSDGAYPIIFYTNAAEKMRLDSSGNLGLGVTPSAWSQGKGFEVGYLGNAIWSSASNETIISQGAYYNTGWKYATSSIKTSYYSQYQGTHSWSTAPSGTAGTAITFTQAMTLDASGRLLLGNTTSIASSLGSANMQISGATQGAGSTQNLVFNTSASGPVFELGLSKNATVGSQTIVSSGNNLGSIRFSGSDGTAFIRAAQIAGEVDGTPGTNDMPGRLVFLTTADGASSPTERMRIDSSGNLLVGLTSATGVAKLQVSGPIRTTGYTVATLPAGTVGMRTYVTDATAPTFLGTLIGGGAVTCPVFYNGTAWVAA